MTPARPLTPKELGIFIAVELTSHTHRLANNENGVLTKYKPHLAIDAGCGLLSIDGQVVRPIHFTVHEFIKRNERGIGNEVDVNAFLAESMIHFMICHTQNRRGIEACSTSVFPFCNYHLRKLPLPLPSNSPAAEIIANTTRSRFRTISELDFFASFDLLLVYQNSDPFKSSPPENSYKVERAIIHAADGNSLPALIALLDILKVELLRDRLDDALHVAAGKGHACGSSTTIVSMLTRTVGYPPTLFTMQHRAISSTALEICLRTGVLSTSLIRNAIPLKAAILAARNPTTPSKPQNCPSSEGLSSVSFLQVPMSMRRVANMAMLAKPRSTAVTAKLSNGYLLQVQTLTLKVANTATLSKPQ